MARASFVRDSAGRVTSYSWHGNAPSLGRIREVIHQAEKAGAKSAGAVGDVGEFQAYENKEARRQIVRGYRGAQTPQRLLGTLKGQGSNPGEYAVLGSLLRASGAEMARDLRGGTINFSY